MKTKFIITGVAVFAFALIALFSYAGGSTKKALGSLFPEYGTALAAETGTSKAVFAVHCYDEGKDALRGMKGVQKVEKGFRFLREINTVYYDPEVITIEEMEGALKKAGTYVETIKERK